MARERRWIDYPRAGKTGLRRFLPSWKQLLAMAVLSGAAIAAAFAAALALTTVPEPTDVAAAQTTIVYWADGETELGRLGDTNRISVDLAQVPLDTQHAVLAAEDRQYYEHGGIAPVGIARATWNNLRGNSTQGASTITQQYAKNAFLTQDRTWTRKINEVLLAVKLETVADKDTILGDYLNTVYFGRGAYGIATASQQYFGVDVSKLTASQSAVLAAVLKGPSNYQPSSPEGLSRLKGRWAYVLDGMVTSGWLTPAERSAAAFPKIIEYKPTNRWKGTDGYLLAAVRTELQRRGYTDDEINSTGLRVKSTFDRTAQTAAVQAVRDEGPTTGTKGLRIGLAAVRPGTGEVVAMYGGADYTADQLNNATEAIGQGGSTFKAFGLAAGLENDVTLEDRFSGINGTDVDGYEVVNFGDRSYGRRVSMLTATEKSINSAYVEMAHQVGESKVLDAAIRAGIPSGAPGLKAGKTLVLGTASPHAVDVANAYATFAAHGKAAPTTVIAAISRADGIDLYVRQDLPTQAFEPKVAEDVTYALEQVVENGTGETAQSLGRPAAAKTGTTNGNKSAWFAGYTRQIAASVMFVKDGPDGLPASLSGTGGLDTLTGGSFPARIWTAFMAAALKDQPVLPLLDGRDASASPEPTRSSQTPTEVPTDPTALPTDVPTDPTAPATDIPTTDPTAPVTDTPTAEPTPTATDTAAPTTPPTTDPTASPNVAPTGPPSLAPTAPAPVPTGLPTGPSLQPIAPAGASR